MFNQKCLIIFAIFIAIMFSGQVVQAQAKVASSGSTAPKSASQDYLYSWQVKTTGELESCGKCNKKNSPSSCGCQRDVIRNSVATAPVPDPVAIPKFNGNSVFDNTHRFHRMGYVYLAGASDLLYDDLGILRETFTGTGISSPFFGASNNFNPARSVGLTEYWAPNKKDSDVAVITCTIDRPSATAMNMTVSTLIGANKKTVRSRKNNVSCLNQPAIQQAVRAMRNHEQPTLFRCSKFPKKYYSGSVGRKEAKGVFFSALEDVINLPVGKACTKTGQKINNTAEEQTLFIWIMIPSTPIEAVPATWENLIRHYSKLVPPDTEAPK